MRENVGGSGSHSGSGDTGALESEDVAFQFWGRRWPLPAPRFLRAQKGCTFKL